MPSPGWALRNVRSFKTRFRNVYWVGDLLSYAGSVANLYEAGGRKMVDLELVCSRDTDGAAIADTWMTFAYDLTRAADWPNRMSPIDPMMGVY